MTMTFKTVSPASQRDIIAAVKKNFGRHAVITDNEQIQMLYPIRDGKKPYQPFHGYLSFGIGGSGPYCWVCDSTPDHGDEIVASVAVFK